LLTQAGSSSEKSPQFTRRGGPLPRTPFSPARQPIARPSPNLLTVRPLNDSYDIAIIGAGAAGLMAAIAAGRTARAAGAASASTSIILLDGATTLGAKILVAGGGRCNVTHYAVDETAYAGSSRNAIKKVLRSYTVEQTVAFFEALGVQLKREETGKLFPTTDKARTVLYALLDAAKAAGVHLFNPWRVDTISRDDSGIFTITRATALDASPAAGPTTASSLRARAVILAPGGLSLPKSGSDGHGHTIARSLGHSVTDRVFPSLVPLTIDRDFFTCALMGLAVPATLTVVSGTGKHLVSFTNSTLLTHFGLSGPGPLDISRYYTDAKRSDPAARLLMNFLPAFTTETLDAHLQKYTQPINRFLNQRPQALPDRLARALAEHAGVNPAQRPDQLPRELRRALVTTITALPMPITGDRGYTYAEVTAGGVPLSELHLATMQSRLCPMLFLAGELLDVDGRIGGYNFQWAWASGYLAGQAAAHAIAPPAPALPPAPAPA